MTDPDAVARALARLASGAPREPAPESEQRAAGAVADAEAAMADVERAAAFLDGGGEARLRRAVRTAEAGGDHALAARGRDRLTTLERFRAAASGGEQGARDSGPPRSTFTPLAQRSSGGEP